MNPQLTTAGKVIGLIGTVIWLMGICMTGLLVISFVIGFGVMYHVVAMTVYASPIAGTLLYLIWPLLIVAGARLRNYAFSERFSRMRELSSYRSESRSAES